MTTSQATVKARRSQSTFETIEITNFNRAVAEDIARALAASDLFIDVTLHVEQSLQVSF